MNPDVQANYLASPPLVVAYALAGSMRIDITKDPIGQDKKGKDVFLKDIWPTIARDRRHPEEVGHPGHVRQTLCATSSRATSTGRPSRSTGGQTYAWDDELDLRRQPALLRGPVDGADAGHRHRRGAASWPSSATRSPPTTSRPAGSIKKTSPAGVVSDRTTASMPLDFNSYGARRGNHEVMMRGTFANIRIRNKITPGHRRRRDQALPVGRHHVDL